MRQRRSWSSRTTRERIVASDVVIERGRQARTWLGANQIFENDQVSVKRHALELGWPSQVNGR